MGKCGPVIVAKPVRNNGVSSNRAVDGKGCWGRGPSVIGFVWSSKGSSHDGNSNSTRTIQTSLLLNWIILDFGHDAVFALAMAVEKIGYTSSELQKRNPTGSFDLTDPRTVSQHGPELSYGLSLTRFKGIAGDFSLIDRQRQSSTLVNNLIYMEEEQEQLDFGRLKMDW
ncbi:hypothetical protein ACE6H2_004058 [Prunus campanulata]